MPFRVDLEAPSAPVQRVLEGLKGSAAVDAVAQVFRLPEVSDEEPHPVAHLVTNINLAAIQAAAGNLLLHAGAVCLPDGSTVVVCGPSGSGKTTFTTELLDAGLTYITDETVCLHPRTLRITPFRKPLSIKQGSHGRFRRLQPADMTDYQGSGVWLVTPQGLGTPPPEPLLPVLLIFPTYRTGVDLQVERVADARAAYLLGKNSSRLDAVRGGALPALARLARRAPAYTVLYGDSRAARQAVLELMDTV